MTAPNRLPSGPIKGLNLVNAYSVTGVPGPPSDYYWGHFWLAFPWTGINGFKTQIALAKSVGCNAVRIIGGGPDPVWSGMYTIEDYLAKQGRIAAELASQGMYYYGTEDGYSQLYASNGGFSGVANYIASVAGYLARFPNVMGFDLMTEFNGGSVVYTQDDYDALIPLTVATTRLAAPDTSLTMSFSANADSSGLWSHSYVGRYSHNFDHLDFHVYYDPGPSDAAIAYQQAGTSGKSILIGESGQNMGAGPTARASRVSTVRALVNSPIDGQPPVAGSMYWAAIPQDVPGGADDWGLFDDSDPAALRADVGTPFTAIRVPPCVTFDRKRSDRR